MDVVALAQFDVNYAVASLGTSTTTEQIQLLFRSTEQVICCYDGDRAGCDAAWRALENALPYLEDGRQIKFIFLPDGKIRILIFANMVKKSLKNILIKHSLSQNSYLRI